MDDAIDLFQDRHDAGPMRILPSAHRHGVSVDDIVHAYRYRRWIWEGTNEVTIYIGAARNTDFLEIGVILDEDERPVVVHAMKARRKYLP